MVGHKLEVSIGRFGTPKSVIGRRKVDASDRINLSKAKVPKYTATNLFLKLIAYILRHRKRMSRFVEEKKKKENKISTSK